MIRLRLLLPLVLFTVAGCRQAAAAAEPVATPVPTVTPTATPAPTPTPDDRARRTAVNETVAALRGTVTPTPAAAEPAGLPAGGDASLARAQRQARSLGGLLFVANAGQRPGVRLNVRAGPGLGHAIVGEIAAGDYLVGLAVQAGSGAGCPAGWVWVRDMEPGTGGSTLPAAGGWSCLNYLLDVEGRVGTLPAAVPE